MALPTVKTTYTIDLETKSALDRLAARWEVSKSEALRRAIRQAAGASRVTDRLAALGTLQRRARMTRDHASRWSDAIRDERQATSRLGKRIR
ncbi:MAG TPA: ribbon-helix-helix protein, CopG family [Vicinamibacterales bacterium]|nr:ribbon-helix-helix protein, CopG family [Vicinamibacterales bacterium]